LYSIQAALSGEVPFCDWPQVPQPWPPPGAELGGVSGSFTLLGSSHEAEPLVRISADAPNSAEISFSSRSTVISRSVRNSPSKAQNSSTYSPSAVPVIDVLRAVSSPKITEASSGVDTTSQPKVSSPSSGNTSFVVVTDRVVDNLPAFVDFVLTVNVG